MKQIIDEQLGVIEIRHLANARHLKARILPNGHIGISAPNHAPDYYIKKFINSARAELQALINESTPQMVYQHGTIIGKSHTLIVRPTSSPAPKITTDGLQVFILLPEHKNITDNDIQQLIRAEAIKLLRKQAKSYLPRRLKFIADEHGFNYERVRFSHAGSRWGSCSSTGTISLNIALMKLPHELIDYVLIHELSHTRQMNHSTAFWEIVGSIDPHYKLHRRLIKKETPTI